MRSHTKYIVITGGVLSGIGKGVAASSTGAILKEYGFAITSIKIDPYLNIDAGTMSPFEHGEVFVLDDGGEVDLDLGNYERFIGVSLKRDNNITTGKIYNQVIKNERKGLYLGKTVQVIPHITDAIQDWIERVAKVPQNGKVPDICVIEVGGTIGDIEGAPFIEAMRQFQFRVGTENIFSIHVSLVPVVGAVGEQKTKPTQSSIRELRALGLYPDMILCRSSNPLEKDVREKLSNFCNVDVSSVISIHDVSNLYKVPMLLDEQGVPAAILKKFKLERKSGSSLVRWKKLAETVDELSKSSDEVRIVIVGKYTGLSDSYLSVIKSLQHAAVAVNRKLAIDWIASADLEADSKSDTFLAAWGLLQNADGILVPGGFGDRGIEGKVKAAEYARLNKKPYLGVCLGLQIAVIEIARNIIGLKDANSTEFDEKTPHSVVMFMPEGDREVMGGTMRLGARVTQVEDDAVDCVSARLYGTKSISERHRHRYEVNPEYIPQLRKAGIVFVGFGDGKKRAEIIELKDHPFFVGVQFHPEFKSNPHSPSPPFYGLLLAASNQLEAWKKRTATS
eukprot:TRINITY_DN14484_c0_g1_i1.p1 TRINITY_DN14484_c0_g1~~TRINITY_DN14484_c0_g1_i1.p1  ORF type:complete len:563 (-),score=118.91 TRINITY_DN14484_c0_g1_i1:378-2066(-)